MKNSIEKINPSVEFNPSFAIAIDYQDLKTGEKYPCWFGGFERDGCIRFVERLSDALIFTQTRLDAEKTYPFSLRSSVSILKALGEVAHVHRLQNLWELDGSARDMVLDGRMVSA